MRKIHKGTLWESRFKSVLFEGSRRALWTLASSIDLNAVRAGIVSDPQNYRFCGYGEAMAGVKIARDGLNRVMQGTVKSFMKSMKRLYQACIRVEICLVSHLVSHFVDLDKVRDKVRDKVSNRSPFS